MKGCAGQFSSLYGTVWRKNSPCRSKCIYIIFLFVDTPYLDVFFARDLERRQ